MLLELKNWTDPALLSEPTSSPGTPTASRLVPPTRTVSRLRPNRSPASAAPGTPAESWVRLTLPGNSSK